MARPPRHRSAPRGLIAALLAVACALVPTSAAAAAGSPFPAPPPIPSESKEVLSAYAEAARLVLSSHGSVQELEARLRDLGEDGSPAERESLEAELANERTALEELAVEYQALTTQQAVMVGMISQINAQIVQLTNQIAEQSRSLASRAALVPPPRMVLVTVRGRHLRRITTYFDGQRLARRHGNRIRVRIPFRAAEPGLHHVHTVGIGRDGRRRFAEVWLLRRDDRVDRIVRSVLRRTARAEEPAAGVSG